MDGWSMTSIWTDDQIKVPVLAIMKRQASGHQNVRTFTGSRPEHRFSNVDRRQSFSVHGKAEGIQ